MKKIFYSMIALSIIVLSSCSPDTPVSPTTNNLWSIDTNTYFTISFNNRTIFHNGLLAPGGTRSNDECPMGWVSTTNTNGTTNSDLFILASGSSFNGLRTQFYPYLAYQTCNSGISVKKQGNALGIYTASISNTSSITDISINVGSKKYDIEGISSSFTVTAIDTQFITGNFTCTLIDGTTRIPATGTFKILKY